MKINISATDQFRLVLILAVIVGFISAGISALSVGVSRTTAGLILAYTAILCGIMVEHAVFGNWSNGPSYRKKAMLFAAACLFVEVGVLIGPLLFHA